MSQVEDRLSGLETNYDKDRTISKDERNIRDLGDITKR